MNLKPKLTLNQKAAAIVLIPFFFQIVLFLLYNDCMHQAEIVAAQEYRAKNMIGHANWFSTVATTSTLSLSTFVRTKRPEYLANFHSEVHKLRVELVKLKQIAATDPDQAINSEQLTTATDNLIAQFGKIETAAKNETVPPATVDSPEFLDAFSRVFQARSRLLATESRHHLIDSPQIASEQRRKTEEFIAVGIFIDVFAALFMIRLFSKNIAARLNILSDNTTRLANKMPLNPVMQGTDEISQLDRVFHLMADALETASRRERAILDHAADVICSLDNEGRITEINPACLQAWGYEPADLLGKRYVELVVSHQQRMVVASLQTGAKNKERFSFENQMVRQDGSAVFVRWSACWSDEEQSYFCVAHDVSHEKYVEQLKGQFMSMVSHDLRTPLSAISSFLELMISGRLGRLAAPCAQMAVQCQRTIRRLIKLTDDLLVIERIEAGAMPLEMTMADIKTVIQDAIVSVKPLADEAKITIDDTAVTSEQVELDGSRITQVVVNLLSNAIKFTPSDACIKVSAVRTGGWLELSVIDPGRGIPEHAQNLLFDRYRQVELRDSKKGSGLGLAICKQIIEQHGGRTGVESQVGRGSRFWFSIPLQRLSLPLGQPAGESRDETFVASTTAANAVV